MSKLKQNLNFIHLVVNTSKTQAIALLETVTKTQTDCVSEIILNITLGNLVKLDSNIKNLLHKRRRFINILKDRKVTNFKRSSTIKSHPQIVLNILKIAKDKLIKYVKEKYSNTL